MAEMQKVPYNAFNPLTDLVSVRICFAFNLDFIWLFFHSKYVFVFFPQNDLLSAKDCMKFKKGLKILFFPP